MAPANETLAAPAMTVRSSAAGFATGTRTRLRALNIALWAVQVLLAAFLLFASAAPKFAGQKDAVETFARIGWGQWFRYVTGMVEAAGAIGLLIPRLAGPAAAGLIGLMAGAITTQVLVLDPAWAVLPAVFGVLFGVIAWVRRPWTGGRTGRSSS